MVFRCHLWKDGIWAKNSKEWKNKLCRHWEGKTSRGKGQPMQTWLVAGEMMLEGYPPGQPSHSGPWRFGDLCSVTGGAQWDPVFWAMKAPSRADRTHRGNPVFLFSRGNQSASVGTNILASRQQASGWDRAAEPGATHHWAVCDQSSGRWAQNRVGSNPRAWPELVKSGSGAAATAPLGGQGSTVGCISKSDWFENMWHVPWHWG